MTAELLALLDKDSAAGILAVADLRERRANAVTEGPYAARKNDGGYEIAAGERGAVWLYIGDDDQDRADAEHLAAEAAPAHALAAVCRWRRVVERHVVGQMIGEGEENYAGCEWCWQVTEEWPCPDLRETADEARAYIHGGGAS